MLLGTTFFGGEDTISPVITDIQDCQYISISNCVLDELFAANKTEEIIDEDWQHSTILHATYDSNLDAGNVDYNTTNTSHIAVKRREEGKFDWMTIKIQEILEPEDFKFKDLDRFAKIDGTKYEYAIVPYYQGKSGNYNIVKVASTADGIFIASKDEMYGTFLEISHCDTSRQVPNNFITPKNSRFPRSIRNCKQNNDTGNAFGVFIPIDNCEFNVKNGTKYRKDIVDFLADGKPKILKHFDGRMWLINVDNSIEDTSKGDWRMREISFNWVETGDCASEKDLYYAGLSDVTSEWWVK